VTRCCDDLDLDGTLYAVRDNLGRADAFLTAAEGLIERPEDGDDGEGDDDDGDDDLGRRRHHESAKLEVRAAIYGGGQIAAVIERHQAVSSWVEVATATAQHKHRGRT
jgi:FMN phosphatase YigB (HAD superfamily)